MSLPAGSDYLAPTHRPASGAASALAQLSRDLGQTGGGGRMQEPRIIVPTVPTVPVADGGRTTRSPFTLPRVVLTGSARAP